MYFNDCRRVSSTFAVKSHPTFSLPLFNRLMLCTVNHSYFKNKKYNENVGKGSIFLQSADIPQISASPDMEVLNSMMLSQPEALRRQGWRGGFVFTRWSNVVQVISTLTTVTWANCHLNQKRQRPHGPQPLARVWQLNEGAGPHLSPALQPTPALPESCKDSDPETTCSCTHNDPVAAQRNPRGTFLNLHMEWRGWWASWPPLKHKQHCWDLCLSSRRKKRAQRSCCCT